MDAVEPPYGTVTLLLIAVAAVFLLLLLIMRYRLHAFVARVLVSLLTAPVTRIPFPDLVPTLLSGFGRTLATVALLVGFGAMIGRLLEVKGGAQVPADRLIDGFGEARPVRARGRLAPLRLPDLLRRRPHRHAADHILGGLPARRAPSLP